MWVVDSPCEIGIGEASRIDAVSSFICDAIILTFVRYNQLVS